MEDRDSRELVEGIELTAKRAEAVLVIFDPKTGRHRSTADMAEIDRLRTYRRNAKKSYRDLQRSHEQKCGIAELRKHCVYVVRSERGRNFAIGWICGSFALGVLYLLLRVLGGA